MHFLLKSLATTLGISCIPVALLIIHPVIANENKIETIDLESVKKIGWMNETTLNICNEFQEVSAPKTYHHQIAIAMAAIIVVQISHHGKNA